MSRPPDANDSPDVRAEQEGTRQSGELVGPQLVHVWSVPPFAQRPIGDRNQNHRYPC